MIDPLHTTSPENLGAGALVIVLVHYSKGFECAIRINCFGTASARYRVPGGDASVRIAVSTGVGRPLERGMRLRCAHPRGSVSRTANAGNASVWLARARSFKSDHYRGRRF